MVWRQKIVSLKAPKRGMHLVTDKVLEQIGADLQGIKIGLCNLFGIYI
jgi:hypothetical protein